MGFEKKWLYLVEVTKMRYSQQLELQYLQIFNIALWIS